MQGTHLLVPRTQIECRCGWSPMLDLWYVYNTHSIMHGDNLHTHLFVRVCMVYIVVVLIRTCCHVYYSIVYMPQTECRWLYRDHQHRNALPENVRTTSAVEVLIILVWYNRTIINDLERSGWPKESARSRVNQSVEWRSNVSDDYDLITLIW